MSSLWQQLIFRSVLTMVLPIADRHGAQLQTRSAALNSEIAASRSRSHIRFRRGGRIVRQALSSEAPLIYEDAPVDTTEAQPAMAEEVDSSESIDTPLNLDGPRSSPQEWLAFLRRRVAVSDGETAARQPGRNESSEEHQSELRADESSATGGGHDPSRPPINRFVRSSIEELSSTPPWRLQSTAFDRPSDANDVAESAVQPATPDISSTDDTPSRIDPPAATETAQGGQRASAVDISTPRSEDGIDSSAAPNADTIDVTTVRRAGTIDLSQGPSASNQTTDDSDVQDGGGSSGQPSQFTSPSSAASPAPLFPTADAVDMSTVSAPSIMRPTPDIDPTAGYPPATPPESATSPDAQTELTQQGEAFSSTVYVPHNPDKYDSSHRLVKHGRTIGDSGPTIGYGYDFGKKSADQIRTDFSAIGLKDNDVEALTKLAGRHGMTNEELLKLLAETPMPSLSLEQAQALFNRTYSQESAEAERVFQKHEHLDIEQLAPAIKSVIVDLKFQGNLTPARRSRISAILAKGGSDQDILTALKQLLTNDKNLPKDNRFKLRVEYIDRELNRTDRMHDNNRSTLPLSSVSSQGNDPAQPIAPGIDDDQQDNLSASAGEDAYTNSVPPDSTLRRRLAQSVAGDVVHPSIAVLPPLIEPISTAPQAPRTVVPIDNDTPNPGAEQSREAGVDDAAATEDDTPLFESSLNRTPSSWMDRLNRRSQSTSATPEHTRDASALSIVERQSQTVFKPPRTQSPTPEYTSKESDDSNVDFLRQSDLASKSGRSSGEPVRVSASMAPAKAPAMAVRRFAPSRAERPAATGISAHRSASSLARQSAADPVNTTSAADTTGRTSGDDRRWRNVPAPWMPLPDWINNDGQPSARSVDIDLRRSPDLGDRSAIATASPNPSIPVIDGDTAGIANADVDALAVKVYQIIKRRVSMERRRRGTER